MLSKLVAATLTAVITTASLAAPAVAQVVTHAKASTHSWAVIQRTRTAEGTRVQYVLDDKIRFMVTNEQAGSVDFTDGPNLLMRIVADCHGGFVVWDAAGRRYTKQQLDSDPSLLANFDFASIIALDDEFGFLLLGEDTSAGKKCNSIVKFLFCAAAVYVANCISIDEEGHVHDDCTGWF